MRKSLWAIALLLASASAKASENAALAADYLDNLFQLSQSSMTRSQQPLTLQDASMAEKVLKDAIEKEKVEESGAGDKIQIHNRHLNLQEALLALARLYKSQLRQGELTVILKQVVENYDRLAPADRKAMAQPMLDLALKLAQSNDAAARDLVKPVLNSLEGDNDRDTKQLTDLAAQLKSRDPESSELVLRTLLKYYSRNRSKIQNTQGKSDFTVNIPDLNSIALANTQIKLAELLKDTDRSAAALELAEMALSEQEALGADFKARLVPTFILLCDLELKNKNTRAAENYASKLQQTLEPTSGYVPDRSSLLGPVLDLCVAFARAGDFETVKKLFDCSLNLRVDRGYAPYENKLREISRGLAEAGNKESCESLYLDYLEACLSARFPGDDANSTTSALHALTQYYCDRGDWSKLSALIDRIATRDSKEHRHTLRDFASHFTTAGDTVQEKYYLTVLAQGKYLTSDRRQDAQYRARLAELYLKLGKEKAAQTQWRLIVASLKESLPREFQDLANQVDLVITTYVRQKSYRNAQQIADNMANYGFDQNILTAAANGFLAMAQAQDSLGNTSLAETLCQRALAVCIHYGSRTSDNYSTALSLSARYLRKLGHSAEADQREQEAAALKQKLKQNGIL